VQTVSKISLRALRAGRERVGMTQEYAGAGVDGLFFVGGAAGQLLR